MSTRERWIVYPLVFLTLGIALRDKLIPPARFGNLGMRLEAGEIATPRIRCNELHVRQVVCDRLESKQLESVQSQCQKLIVTAPNGRPVVLAGADASTQAGMIETFTAKGLPQIQLLSSDTGGLVTTIGHSGKVLLVMGHTGKTMGVFAQIPGRGSPIQLTPPTRFEDKETSPKSPTKPAASEKPADKPEPKKTPVEAKKDG
jgi:hypothetical protein